MQKVHTELIEVRNHTSHYVISHSVPTLGLPFPDCILEGIQQIYLILLPSQKWEGWKNASN
jgi:hypothetical protein